MNLNLSDREIIDVVSSAINELSSDPDKLNSVRGKRKSACEIPLAIWLQKNTGIHVHVGLNVVIVYGTDNEQCPLKINKKTDHRAMIDLPQNLKDIITGINSGFLYEWLVED